MVIYHSSKKGIGAEGEIAIIDQLHASAHIELGVDGNCCSVIDNELSVVEIEIAESGVSANDQSSTVEGNI